ncbi:MAG: hypothetical protein WEA11_06045 [Acidimicrobiales bacterium]
MASGFELVGVYDADGTTIGEIRYWIGARLGRNHCSLCELTHGSFRERSDWRDCRQQMAIEFSSFHRDDAPQDVLEAVDGRFPIVVAKTDTNGIVIVLSPEDLDQIHGDLEHFKIQLEAACTRLGLGQVFS